MATKVVKKALTTERQRELLRVLEIAFTEFDKRGQTNYALNGMTTHHVVVHSIQDFTTLKAFWPSGLVTHRYGQTIYQLDDDTMSKVRGAVTDTLNQLVEKGYVEKVGNAEERRWLLIREKRIHTVKEAHDPDGNKVGYYERINDGEWKLHLN
jgi:hypothetical protein